MASGATTSTPKISKYLHESFDEQYSSDGKRLKEVSQNERNAALERSQQQQQQHETLSSSWNNSGSNNSSLLRRIFSKSLGASVSAAANNRSNATEDSEHLAYLEYKRVGEYWKKTPKTDYTYSYLSTQRRELAPGVIAMPNMSRRSLDQHYDRVTRMLQSNPYAADSIRRRYLSKDEQKTHHSIYYESGDDELDASNVENISKKSFYLCGAENGKRRVGGQLYAEQQNWFERILTSIVTIFTSIIWSSSSQTTDDSALYYTQTNVVQTGFWGSIGHGISSAVMSVFRQLYLLISTVLYWDTWLLQSNNPNGKTKKRFLLLLLILLPLLLLTGLFYYLHPDETFPPRYWSEYTFTLPTSLPKIDLAEYINRESYESIKEQTYARLLDLRSWTDDYLLYLKTVSQNLADEGRKIFQREEHFDRI